MERIANLELNPRRKDRTKEEIRTQILEFIDIFEGHFDQINFPHFPEVSGRSILSPEELALNFSKKVEVVQHLRTCEASNPEDLIRKIKDLISFGVTEVLLVSGDRDNKESGLFSHEVLSHVPEELINKVSVDYDCYQEAGRSRFLEHKKEFVNSGSRVFTQPMFSVKRVKEELKTLKERGFEITSSDFMVGVDYVASSRMVDYWINKNNVDPSDLPNKSTNTEILNESKSQVIEVLRYLRANNYSEYNMFMGTNPKHWLEIFEKLENLEMV